MKTTPQSDAVEDKKAFASVFGAALSFDQHLVDELCEWHAQATKQAVEAETIRIVTDMAKLVDKTEWSMSGDVCARYLKDQLKDLTTPT
jgi:hypothetical protein